MTDVVTQRDYVPSMLGGIQRCVEVALKNHDAFLDEFWLNWRDNGVLELHNCYVGSERTLILVRMESGGLTSNTISNGKFISWVESVSPSHDVDSAGGPPLLPDCTLDTNGDGDCPRCLKNGGCPMSLFRWCHVSEAVVNDVEQRRAFKRESKRFEYREQLGVVRGWRHKDGRVLVEQCEPESD